MLKTWTRVGSTPTRPTTFRRRVAEPGICTMVESHRIGGSNPPAPTMFDGGMAEWTIATGCSPVVPTGATGVRILLPPSSEGR